MDKNNEETFDLTPTWFQVFVGMLVAYSDSDPKGRKALREEFATMAMAADKYNTAGKPAYAALKRAQKELYEQAGEEVGSGRYSYIDEAIKNFESK